MGNSELGNKYLAGHAVFSSIQQNCMKKVFFNLSIFIKKQQLELFKNFQLILSAIIFCR